MDHPIKLPFSLRYTPMLDGIRGLALLAVLMVHMKIPYMQWGFVGMDVFFCLSGFLITSVLIQEWAQTGKISFKNFYARRALRLLPALSILLVVTLAPLNPVPFSQRLKATGIALFYSANWVRALAPDFNLSALSHTWSLSVEEQFYLLWPIALVLLLRQAPSGKRLGIILFSAILAFACWRTYLCITGATAMRMYNGLDTRADSLLAGCLLSLMLSFGQLKGGIRLGSGAKLSACILVIPGLMLLIRADWDRAPMFLGGYTLASLIAAGIIFLAVTPGSNGLKAFLSFSPFVWMGKVSYGVYLWHYPIFGFFDTLKIPLVLRLGGMWIATLLAAALSYYCLELRFLRMKEKFK